MPASREHRQIVESCLPAEAGTLLPGALAQAFERAFTALWRRANATLGQVTLQAVVQRVVDGTGEQFPALAGVDATSATSVTASVEARGSGMAAEELRRALVFLLVEFLTVLGRLTAEILTPGLHAELLALATGGVKAARASGEEPQS